jgi:hypothetical protein
MNKSKSLVNFFALSLSNPTTIISFAKKNDYLNNMTLCHLIKYCKSNPSTIIAKAQKVSANTTEIKYNMRTQVPKGLKNVINLDKKNVDNL